MRRLALSTKLLAAALPLVVAVGGLLALTVRSDLDEIGRAQSGAELGGVWEPLIAALGAVEAEAAEIDTSSAADGEATTATAGADVRRTTDQAINDVRDEVESLGAFDAASQHVTASRSALSAARRSIDLATVAPEMAGDIDPIEAYATASRELVAVGQLLPSEAGDSQLGSELLAVVKLAEAKLHANDVIAGTSQWPNAGTDDTPLVQARVAYAKLIGTLGEFQAIAPDVWTSQFRSNGFNTTIARLGTELDQVARAAASGRVEQFDSAAFLEVIDQGVGFQRSISQSIVDRANDQATDTRNATLIRIGIILIAVFVASLVAWLITRSITRRVKAVADNANQVASEQLPALVEALRDPRGKSVLPDIAPVDAKGGDDLADLATAFNSMQETLIDVAHEQVEVLRRGVSDIFVTMARRNRSLIDRQLAMLDEYEAEVDDPDVLANYYQLDHLATRMRRNSESLLVLANAEPKRRRVKATEIDDVVRASIGEVEDYLRIEIQNLESLQVKGNVVADISHLLAELLDNATSFSPPGSPVRIGGRHAGDAYMLRIVDDGVGIGPERLDELNELLREPPIVGLSVESTLGVSVVSLLAAKHNIEVTLSAGNPGLTVDVVLPSSLFGPIDTPSTPAPAAEPIAVDQDETIVAWNDQPDGTVDEQFEQMIAMTDLAAEHDSEASVGSPIAADAESFESTSADTTPAYEPVFHTELVAEEPAITEEPHVSAPAPDPAITFDTEPAVASTDDPAITFDTEPAVASTDSTDWGSIDLDLSVFDTEPTAPEQPGSAFELPDLPPPLPSRAEFDVPPAPPMTADFPSQRPVSPDTARPAPATESAPAPTADLPTRTQRGTGPVGPDRLAEPVPQLTDDAPVTGSDPSALQAALAAFDSGRADATMGVGGDLPTRPATSGPIASFDEVQSVSQNRVDPDALRDRLRSFQSEFSSGHVNATGHDPYDQNDLGGDPR